MALLPLPIREPCVQPIPLPHFLHLVPHLPTTHCDSAAHARPSPKCASPATMIESATFSTLTGPIKAITRKQTNKGWQFHEHWRSAKYHTGDLYQDQRQDYFRDQWEVRNPQPYLKYVRDLSLEWPHLRGLADFMEVGTDPLRWRDFFSKDKDNKYTYPDDKAKRDEKQKMRVEKTNVSQLVYFADGTVTCETYTTPEELRTACLDAKPREEPEEQPKGEDESRPRLRLFVVEDLSRAVIEQLGSTFDIDPEFFRAHVFDWVWFNIRDPLWMPPTLHVDAAHRNWYQLRFCRARYFSSSNQFKQGQAAVDLFNVGRKLYEDENKAFWDSDTPSTSEKGLFGWVRGVFQGGDKKPAKEKGPDEERLGLASEKLATAPNPEASSIPEKVEAKVGYMRTRATMWKRPRKRGDCDIAVLLLDPTIEEGLPLWRGYRNWNPVPSMRHKASLTIPSVPSLTRRRTRPSQQQQMAASSSSSPPPSFYSDFLFWATHPSPNPTSSNTNPDPYHIPTIALLRLVAAEWLTMSQYIKTRLSQIDWEITHPNEFLSQTQFDIILNKLHTWRRLVPQFREMLTETQAQTRLFHDHKSKTHGGDSDTSPLHPFQVEFRLIFKQMEEYESRIDRLTTVVTSAISIADSRRVERLTILAMLFVPLSLVGTLFSMSDDIVAISDTFGYWAIASAFCVAVLFGWTGWSRKQSANLKAR
ncbi:hypothetical protein QBC34DRAFT_403192 [Podospora aff. communis PSN243]|uniref:Uncharacterized protein n=1 Tax=Podospora aff. communis PSN243 TaxID=3040156 RepID=A0AAV9GQE8_9PEZI|nr:hypothetical protein QBC34DRAFT_403192 [Podospora aff. communis PSN243]